MSDAEWERVEAIPAGEGWPAWVWTRLLCSPREDSSQALSCRCAKCLRDVREQANFLTGKPPWGGRAMSVGAERLRRLLPPELPTSLGRVTSTCPGGGSTGRRPVVLNCHSSYIRKSAKVVSGRSYGRSWMIEKRGPQLVKSAKGAGGGGRPI
ncbi:hypothetical protein GCM10010326_03370 [Streptomyces xanthochromogenes]|uniref:Transposase n=1 Tax=Streptomyces xanthochromogenes TaxID=67384 RepID=A0ABQ2ZIB4_9ACTN|nr:hypothetical protein GCM10010326_03370 [Streptomyces xanthochromogenes]